MPGIGAGGSAMAGGQLATLSGELDGLHGKLGFDLEQLQVDLHDPHQLRRWLNRAGGLIVDSLLEVEG